MPKKKIKTFPKGNCVLCSLDLSPEFVQAIWYRQVPDDVILDGLANRLGIFVTEKDLSDCRKFHMGFQVDTPDIKKVNEVDAIDERISKVKEKLDELENSGNVYSVGYAGLNRTYVDLIKQRAEITKGININLNTKVSITDWVRKKLEEDEVKK
jgi:hypothetical protein